MKLFILLYLIQMSHSIKFNKSVGQIKTFDYLLGELNCLFSLLPNNNIITSRHCFGQNVTIDNIISIKINNETYFNPALQIYLFQKKYNKAFKHDLILIKIKDLFNLNYLKIHQDLNLYQNNYWKFYITSYNNFLFKNNTNIKYNFTKYFRVDNLFYSHYKFNNFLDFNRTNQLTANYIKYSSTNNLVVPYFGDSGGPLIACIFNNCYILGVLTSIIRNQLEFNNNTTIQVNYINLVNKNKYDWINEIIN